MRLSFFKNTLILVKLGFKKLIQEAHLKTLVELSPQKCGDLSLPKIVFSFKIHFLVLSVVCFSCGSGNKDRNADTSKETLRQAQDNVVIHDMVDVEDFEARSGKREDGSSKMGAENDTIKKYGRSVDGLSMTHIFTGANQWQKYLELLNGKKVGIVANQTSIVNDTLEYPKEARVVDMHLVDFLVEFEVDVYKVFAPEHGFRGKADAGEAVKDGIDTKTGLPIISLYGKNKKPTQKQLDGIEVMVFDIQDVGVRFYTYVATLHYVMEACAEAGIPLIILDRPNPNGHYIDGPMMEEEHRSFLGMHPVPLVHGMTIGEYAQMINGEEWLAKGSQCQLKVIQLKNYTHQTPYSLPVRPSPNLPNDVAVNLYPSLGLFEGTNLNAGRGTEMQFQLFGSPFLPKEFYPFSYTPQSNFGSKNPKHKGMVSNGLDLRDTHRMNRLDLNWIIEAYVNHEKKEKFFNTTGFTAHAGTTELQRQIEQGYTFKEIRKTWLRDLQAYDKMRQKYLLYE
jgi:uncharacterized protein YbbC (DUF1343 family)